MWSRFNLICQRVNLCLEEGYSPSGNVKSTYWRCVGVIPVQLIADDVLPAVIRLLPSELDVGAAHITGHQTAGLAGDSLLGLHLDRGWEWPRPNAGVRLHPDGVDGVRGEVTDGGQLVVVNKLRLPLRQGELGLGGEVHLKILDSLGKLQNLRYIWNIAHIWYLTRLQGLFVFYSYLSP